MISKKKSSKTTGHTKVLHRCSTCGRKIRGNAFYTHLKVCQGARTKVWFGKKIRRLRTEKFPGLSQQRAAFAWGISPQTLNRIELGKEWPRKATLDLIAKALGIKSSGLMS